MEVESMKLYIICSEKRKKQKAEPFNVLFDNVFAERFIKHLKDDPTLCRGCGKDCTRCRRFYNLDYSSSILGIKTLPFELPFYLDNPFTFFKNEIPEHDVTVAINIHEDIALFLPEILYEKTKAIIYPIEGPDWISRWVINKITEKANKLGIEVSFPKPFCSLEKGINKTINQFIEYFRIGKPKVKIKVNKLSKVIEEVKVLISTPCGSTYYVAKNLEGKEVKDLLKYVSKYWHSYPCVASMRMDKEIGDTILHKAGYIQYEVFEHALWENFEVEVWKEKNL